MIHQTKISKIFNVHPSEISRMLNPNPTKRKQPTYNFAIKLKKRLGGGVQEWREVSRENLILAFELVLDSEKEVA